MATKQEVQQALLDAIQDAANEGTHPAAQVARNLAEAYAWITSPAQPHGGSGGGSE